MTTGLMLDKTLTLRVGEFDTPALAAGDVRLAPEWAGLCGSDLHVLHTGAWVDYWPAVLGHEVIGTVTDPGTSTLAVGTRVIADSRYACGNCADCARSARFCGALTWLGESRPGGFATQLDVTATRVSVVPDGLASDVAVLAEPLAVVMRALDAVHEAPSTILLLGYGPIGALTHREAVRRWPEAAISVSEPAAHRAAGAALAGADVLSDSPQDSGFDLVIDAAGFPGAVRAAFSAARRGGSVLLVAIGDHPIGLTSQEFVEKGVSLFGGIGFDDGDIDRALVVLAANPDAFADIVTHRIDLTAFPEFLGNLAGANAGKVLIRCQA